ncbi:hypothetical protein XaC1_112 [Xanthomonas phage XaC1]|nr:hypothetical protein XaC1_112 [Xanthomonas phage XaC1]
MSTLLERLDILLKLSQLDTLKLMYPSNSSHAFILPYEVQVICKGVYNLLHCTEHKLLGVLTEGYWVKQPGEIEIEYRDFNVFFTQEECRITCYQPEDIWKEDPDELVVKSKEDFFNLMLVRELPISYNDYEDLMLYSNEFNKHVTIYMVDLHV